MTAQEGGASPGSPGTSASSSSAAAELLDLVPWHTLEAEERGPCVICHESMTSGDEVRPLPCLHLFHRACIDRWLEVKASCPLDNLMLQDMLSGEAVTRSS
mmetsp:Transcript_179825/g.437559  ORF Transcript_179825/g.437559 Transcript_179825/m.437559 type:complete len:101 (+) Transcript_179825:2-304(+)